MAPRLWCPSLMAEARGIPHESLPRSRSGSQGALTLGDAFDLCPAWVSDGCCFPNYPLHVGLRLLFVLTRSVSQEKKKYPARACAGRGSAACFPSARRNPPALRIALGAPTHGRQFRAPWLVS